MNFKENNLISGDNDNLLCIWDINGLNNLKKNTNINFNKIFDYPILQTKFCLTKHISAIKAINFSLYERNIIVSYGGKKDKSFFVIEKVYYLHFKNLLLLLFFN